MSEETCQTLKGEVPFSELRLPLPAGLLDVLTAANVCESRGEAKRAIRQGGVSVNGVRVSDEGASVESSQLRCGRYLFVRVGRKNFHLIEML